MNPPRSRRDELLTTKLDDEVVIYDPETKQAHSLNRLAVAVWTHADVADTIEDLNRRVSHDLGVPIDRADVLSAIRKLDRARLLVDKFVATGPMTRRQLLGKGGKLGAAAMVTPLVASALVPMAAAAASPNPGQCPTGVCLESCVGGVPAPGGVCACTTAIEGGAHRCGENFFCGTTAACVSSADCVSAFGLGSYCQGPNCGGCGPNVCVPACGTPGFLAPATPGRLRNFN
jgi:hypothetical protein